MIEDTVGKIEDAVRHLSSISDERRDEITALLGQLKSEVVDLSETETEMAESVTRFAELSAYEATRQGRNPQLQEISLDGLAKSVDGFEVTHPRLVKTVNSLCTMLANLGI